MPDTSTDGSVKVTQNVQGRDADKILYFYKRIQKESKTAKIHILGLQGATSGTNQRTLQSTATKTANIKGVGSITQQRTVDAIFGSVQAGIKDLYWDLYDAWEKGELIGLWRVDFNTVKGVKGSRTVEAEFSQSYLPNLPNTEALAGTLTSNLQFEVNGLARDLNSDGNVFTLNEADFEDNVFDSVSKFYNFSHGTDIGVDDKGAFVDETKDDETIKVRDVVSGEDVDGPDAPTTKPDPTKNTKSTTTK